MTGKKEPTGRFWTDQPVIGSDMAKVDAHVITPEEYEEIPELTDEDFARAIFHRNGVPLGPVSRGRPRLPSPRRQVTLRLEADVLERWRATGPGWQTRINEVLKKALG